MACHSMKDGCAYFGLFLLGLSVILFVPSYYLSFYIGEEDVTYKYKIVAAPFVAIGYGGVFVFINLILIVFLLLEFMKWSKNTCFNIFAIFWQSVFVILLAIRFKYNEELGETNRILVICVIVPIYLLMLSVSFWFSFTCIAEKRNNINFSHDSLKEMTRKDPQVLLGGEVFPYSHCFDTTDRASLPQGNINGSFIVQIDVKFADDETKEAYDVFKTAVKGRSMGFLSHKVRIDGRDSGFISTNGFPGWFVALEILFGIFLFHWLFLLFSTKLLKMFTFKTYTIRKVISTKQPELILHAYE